MKIAAGFALLFSHHLVAVTKGELIISEVAARGSSGVCQGRDWIEIYNNDTTSVDLFAGGYMLHDDKGYNHEDAFFFPEGTVAQADEFLLVCTKSNDVPFSPQFGIGRDDTITLLATVDDSSAAVGRAVGAFQVVSSVGPLPFINVIDGFEVSYALDTATGMYNYTSTPTPGAVNVLTPAGTTTEQVAALKGKLSAQSTLGSSFFDMDDRGFPVPDGMDAVVDLRLAMLEEDYSYMLQNATYEVNRPFQSAIVTKRDSLEEVLLALTSPGRVRPNGQFTLYMPLCVGVPNFPFQLDFDNINSSQTLFGAERVYLRNHFMDNSYVRDWAYYRMAARFGLPHLRTRKVRFFINDQFHGLFTLMESPDQDYVIHRNFPLYDPTNFALFKVKTPAVGCGQYTDEELEVAQARLTSSTEATPPYAYERGEHQPLVPVLGPAQLQDCFFSFIGGISLAHADATLAYLRYDKSCPNMLLEEGLVDRDLGSSSWDDNMKDFIRAGAVSYPDLTKGASTIDPIANPLDAAEWMDLNNALKMIAFYAVTLNVDSPLGSGNNVYWLQSGEEANGGSGGWKMFPYDFNLPNVLSCGTACDNKAVYWSIVQPTCSHPSKNPVVGPLLSDSTSLETYLEYVREFVDTIYANESFVQELQEHLQAQDIDVRSDSWSAGGMFYDAELSPDAAMWNHSIPNFPLLPYMKARATSVREQLEAIDNGRFPRGPHGIGVGGDYEMWESCPDWRLTEAPGSACPQSCKYEGCHMPGWIVESLCDEATNTCVHGEIDLECTGVADGGRYEGMDEGIGIMCVNLNGFNVKMSPCPAFEYEGTDLGEEAVEMSSGATSFVSMPAFYPMAFAFIGFMVG